MPVSYFMDVHVNGSITKELRRRGVDVLTAQEDGSDRLEDDLVLERARVLGRVVFTQDIGFKALAESWQAQGRGFAGLAFAHQMTSAIGKLVQDLELIAFASDPYEWVDKVQHLPFK